MKAQIVSIGNSQGIRIPKTLLEQSGLSGEVELELCDEGLIVKKNKVPRGNWEEAFKAMAENDDDELSSGGLGIQTAFDKDNWRW